MRKPKHLRRLEGLPRGSVSGDSHVLVRQARPIITAQAARTNSKTRACFIKGSLKGRGFRRAVSPGTSVRLSSLSSTEGSRSGRRGIVPVLCSGTATDFTLVRTTRSFRTTFATQNSRLKSRVFRGITHELGSEAATREGTPAAAIPVIKLLGYLVDSFALLGPFKV
jgi:hypothetical protein